MAVGSSKGAVAMRYARLKKRIEQETGTAAGNQVTGTGSAQRSKATKATKESAGSRNLKRKAPDAEEEDDEDNSKASLPQVDGADDEICPGRQTRGNKVNYDLDAVYGDDVFTSDEESSLSSWEGDLDSVFGGTSLKHEDEDDSSNAETDTKPQVKRLKHSSSSAFDRQTTPTPKPAAAQREHVPITPPSSVSKLENKVTRKTAAPKTAKEMPPKMSVPFKANIRSTMHPSQRLLPSIESSPPLSPTPALATKKQQSVASTDDDTDVKNLKPGTILYFPAKRQMPVSTSTSYTSFPEPERFSTPITIASSTSSSHDSAGKMLKGNLEEHVQQMELRPEDSVSNIGARAEEDAVMERATPTGKQSPALRPQSVRC